MKLKIAQRISLLVLALAMFSLSACHTVAGAGKDLEKVGEEIQDTSDDVRTDNNER